VGGEEAHTDLGLESLDLALMGIYRLDVGERASV